MSVILVKKVPFFAARLGGEAPSHRGGARGGRSLASTAPRGGASEREKFGFQDPTRAILSFLRVPGASRFLTQISTQTPNWKVSPEIDASSAINCAYSVQFTYFPDWETHENHYKNPCKSLPV